MDDTSLVTCFESRRNLPRDGERFLDRDRAFLDSLCQRRSLDQLEDERLHPVRFLESMDARDVRMIQRREELGFTLEPRESSFVVHERLGKDFDRHVSLELLVTSAVHLAHAAFADWGEDLTGA